MIIPLIFALISLIATTTPAVQAQNDIDFLSDEFGFSMLQQRLPKPISDHTATLDVSTGLTYLAGGCDSPNGNVRMDSGYYSCSSISNQLYRFDQATKQFQTLAPLPAPRYRHAAAFVNNQLWLMGGRDAQDTLLPTVDVYDAATDSWRSFDLPENYRTSDNAGFHVEETKQVYCVGGYTSDYAFKDAVFAIDVDTSIASGLLVVINKAPLLVARGDLAAAANQAEHHAIVTGGFGREMEFCAPLKDAEEYDFRTDTWTRIPDLQFARGDKALTVLEGHFFALGGERQIEDICERLSAGNEPRPGEETIPISDVEAYSATLQRWIVLAKLPDHRFRFAAVGYDDAREIYMFGGQEAYEASCNCFRTTGEIHVFAERSPTSAGTRDWASPLGTTGTLLMLLLVAVLW